MSNLRSISMEIPKSLFDRLNQRAMADGITLPELFMQALQSQVDEADEDAWDDGPPNILRPGDTP